MGEHEDKHPADALSDARSQFREALLHSHDDQFSAARVTSAAAHFCEVLRARGMSPQGTVVEAKRVIADAIDGDHALLAEKAVLSCIEQYYTDQ